MKATVILIIVALCITATSSFPSKEELACQDFSINLLCPGEDVIEIQDVMYGRKNSEICVASMSEMRDTNCMLLSAFDDVSKRCNNKSDCSLDVSSSVFKDPCPGTRKYLTVRYTCVKFMFNCAGMFSGFKQRQIISTDLLPQDGILVQDALNNLDKVYFATWSRGQEQIKEYDSLRELSRGNPSKTYLLRPGLAVPNFVVYDTNLYYIKDGYCSIVKYGLMLRRRLKEVSVGDDRNNICNIQLSVDEYGLWASYQNNEDNLVILQLDAQDLKVQNSFVINYGYNPAQQKTFMICGVLYIIGTKSNVIEYYFETGVKNSKSMYRSPDDDKFLDMTNISSLSYNPRSKEFYAWNWWSSKAFVYSMEYAKHKPKVTPAQVSPTFEPIVKITKSTKTIDSLLTTNDESGGNKPGDVINKPQNNGDYCSSIHRHGVLWPLTKVGETVVLPCPMGIPENATWECIRDLSLRKASWHIAGPNLAKCSTWVTDIENNFDNDHISNLEAIEDLKVSLHNQLVTAQSLPASDIIACLKLVQKLLNSITTDSYEDAETHIQTTFETLDKLTETVRDHWIDAENLDPQVSSVVEMLTESVGNTMSMYSDINDVFDYDTNKVPVAQRNLIGETLCFGNPSSTLSLDNIRTNVTKTKHYTGNSLNFDVQYDDYEEVCNSTAIFVMYKNLGDILNHREKQLNIPTHEKPWMLGSHLAYVYVNEESMASSLFLTLYNKDGLSGDRRCSYWDYSKKAELGFWDNNLCEKSFENRTHTICDCPQMSGLYGVFIQHKGEAEEDLAMAVTMVTIGLAFCTLCLIVCIIGMICTRDYYFKEMSQKHLLICLLFTEITFILGSYEIGGKTGCLVMSGCLQFFLIASFLWVMMDAVQLYVTYVRGSSTKSLWMVYTSVGYGVPTAIVAISASVDVESYASSKSCWIRSDANIIWCFVIPVCLIVIVNMAMLSITLYKMCKHDLSYTEAARPTTVKMAVRGTALLLSLLSFNWAFGIMWLSERISILGYLFAIFNIFQGLFMVLFRCVIPLQKKQKYHGYMFGVFGGSFFAKKYGKKDMKFSNHFPVRGKDDKNADITYNVNHAGNNTSTMDYKW